MLYPYWPHRSFIHDIFGSGTSNWAFRPQPRKSVDDGVVSYSIDVPGFNKKDLNVEQKGKYVIVSGEKDREGVKQSIYEFFYVGDADNVDAVCEDGVLVVTAELNVVEEDQPRAIPVL